MRQKIMQVCVENQALRDQLENMWAEYNLSKYQSVCDEIMKKH